ncbi:MAG: 30S ribosomal protein S6 [Planctomycetota bacterium]
MTRSRTYESMCILDNREVRKGWQPLKDAVTGVFQKHGAKILSSRRWDERRLAYPMKGQQRGTYLLVYFATDTQALAGIRRDLQFTEPVLRFLTMQCDEVPQTAYEPEAAFDVAAIPADDAPEVDEHAAPAGGGEEIAVESSTASEGGEEPAKAEDKKEEGS